MPNTLPDLQLTSFQIKGNTIHYTFTSAQGLVYYARQTSPDDITIKHQCAEFKVTTWPNNFHFA